MVDSGANSAGLMVMAEGTNAYERMGLCLSAEEARELLPDIRAFAENAKRSPADHELLFLYQRLVNRALAGAVH